MPSKDELLEVIVSDIRGFLDKSEDNSLGSLSQKTGVSKSTIGRYAQDELPTSSLSAENAFAFLAYFHGQSKAAEMMKDAYPRWWKVSGRFLFENNNTKPLSIDIYKYSKVHALIFHQAKLGKLTNAWILENFGKQIGLPARDYLLETGLIAEERGVYYATPIADTNYRAILKRISVECEIFPFESVGNDAFAWEFYEQMPPDCREQVIEALRIANQRVRELMLSIKGQKKEKDWELVKINLFGSWNGTGEDL